MLNTILQERYSIPVCRLRKLRLRFFIARVHTALGLATFTSLSSIRK